MSARRIDEIIEGLQILAKYDKKGFGVQAEHDELFCTIEAAPTSKEIARLDELGWIRSEDDEHQWSKFT